MLPYPLVLLPALGADSRLWEPVVERLGDIVESTVVAHAGDSVESIADNVLAQAPDRFYLAGLSMGGYVALDIALRRTGRLAGLALVNTSARAASPERRASGEGMIELAESGRYDIAVERLAGAVAPPGRDDVVALAAAMAGDLGAAAFRDQQRAALDRLDRRPELSWIDTPTLVVCGTADGVTPLEHSVELAEGIPDAELITIEGCGHFSAVEEPARIAEILRTRLLRVDAPTAR
ncbi:alpha/beta hydrolase [Nocardia sp. NBC_01730]|uniref:alpha/beta fold hydrolase n=1 Tax=Nocardia sp. NBC_01730 TaxID=2975998 RepID=UPI002E0FA960|nr:alpha/beta hydrolase [Nocardia sp. NBC_01730]